mgnify:FL=1
MQFSLGWNRAGAQTPASISSSRLQDRNFTQRGPRKSIEDDFMGKRRNCGVNEHLCFCTDANDTQQVTTRCIIAPYFIGDSERSAFRERHTFASEYVLPTSLLQEKLPNREIHFSDIFTIANEFDVSVTLTAIKSIQYSKTESESLLCYENNRLKWFAFSNNDDMDKSAVPSRCPFDSLLCSQSTDITGYWDDLYRGSVHQEVFSPYGKQRLILLGGQRSID